jgi:histidinol phosphatase-like PHP family hydrolase
MKQLLILALLTTLVTGCKQQPEFPLTDLHIHLKGNLTIEEALKKSEEEGIKYGIAVNCGLGFPVQTDAQADSFFTFMKQYPQFYVGMQAEGREWVDLFSEETFSKFDYVFTDAMTFTDAKGRRNRIWIEDETWIDNEEAFMDYLVETIETILNTEPIDIYVNPTYLPAKMADKYDRFWTAERMDRVIDAACKNGIAIEINNRFKIPSSKFIKRAKKAGVKFTMGTNNVDKNFDGSSYTKKMIRECGLTANDFWLPEMKNSAKLNDAIVKKRKVYSQKHPVPVSFCKL